MGTLRPVDKNSETEKKKHMWVMSISNDLSEISFYDPFLKKQILGIKDKIKNRSMLQWYLLATKMNFQAIKYKLEKIESDADQIRYEYILENNKKNERMKSTFNGIIELGDDKGLLIEDGNEKKVPKISKKLTCKIKN